MERLALMGRIRRFASRTAAQWREGRPGAGPASGESITEWMPRFKEARRALVRKGVGLLTLVLVVVGGVVFVGARRDAQERSRVSKNQAAEVQDIENFVSGV